MCGIVGIQGKTTRSEIKKFLEPITHRGNSQFELDVFELGGIGCDRLPIVDADDGKQPFTNSDNTISVVLNGEIFNHVTLRDDLKKKGYIFKTECDTEVLVHLYAEYGSDFVSRIDSEMYAIIIYDHEKQSLVVARDRLGVKPLYYAVDKNNRYIFASEIKQFAHLNFVNEVTEFPKGTLFDGRAMNSFFDLHSLFESKTVYDKDKLLKLFEQAVKKRVQHKKKVGILYSGGIDSTIVLHFAHKHHSNVVAYICGNQKSLDRKFAQDFCEANGIAYQIVEPRDMCEEDITELVRITETTNFNIVGHSWVNYLVYERMHADKIDVALCGEGADELFGGYNEFTIISPLNFDKFRFELLNSLHHTQLQRVDRTAMNFTIETRCPFLDTALVSFVLGLKDIFDKSISKKILRDTFRGIIPDSIIDRKKMPFSSGAGVGVRDKELSEDIFAEFDYNSIVAKAYSQFGYTVFVETKRVNKDCYVDFI